MSVYYIDGEFVEAEQAVLPVSDLIILRGYGVFDFLRTYNGVPFHLDAHIRRLLNSAALIGLSCPWDFQEIKGITFATMARNSHAESNIRLLISGGDSEDSITPGQKPRLLVLVSPMRSFPREWYQTGVGITTADVARYIPGAKSIDYIRGILALGEANSVGGVEAVYVDGSGRVTEGTTSNIFIVKDGEVITPPDDILPGVTRDVVLDIMTPMFKYRLDFFSREELYAAEEVFLSSSNKEVMPVRMVDETLVGDGSPGPVTKQVMAEFRKYTERYSADNPS